MKKYFLIIFLVAVLFSVVIWALFFGPFKSTDTVLHISDDRFMMALLELQETHPELQEFIDEVYRQEAKVAMDSENDTLYFDLGLSWKSVADRAGDAPNIFYDSAIDIYQKGIELTEHRDTTYLKNTANMYEFQREYDRAEAYLLEAIEVTPGDQELYIRLADIYRYHLSKTRDQIVAFLDGAMKRAYVTNQLQAYKDKIMLQME